MDSTAQLIDLYEETENKPVTKVVAIPTDLAVYKDTIDYALYQLSLGEFPSSPPTTGNEKQQRITLSPAGNMLLDNLLQTKKYGSMKELIVTALQWISEQPPHVINTKL